MFFFSFSYSCRLNDAATDLDLPASDYRLATRVAKDIDTPFHEFAKWVDFYGYDSGTAGTGELVEVGLSYNSFVNHACDGRPNFDDIEVVFDWWNDMEDEGWNPVISRIEGEVSHLAVASRDVVKGEQITGNYTSFDGFVGCFGEEELEDDDDDDEEADPTCSTNWIVEMCKERRFL